MKFLPLLFAPHIFAIFLTSRFATTTQQPILQPLDYKPPRGGEAPPPRTDTGTTRPGCPTVAKPLTALVPKYYSGFTTASHPTFWVFVPYTSTTETGFPRPSVKFILWDSQQKIYETTFPIAGTPGVVSFSLLKNAPPLAIGKTYRWDFSFSCGDGSGFELVQWWIKRVAMPDTLQSKLKAANPRERVRLYAADGLWHEALTELAELRRSQPQNEKLKTDWIELLGDRDVRLNGIISEPIVDCCTYRK